MDAAEPHPVRLDLKKDRGLTVEWSDGVSSFYPVAHLRRMSPSADQRELRKEQARNPLTVLPASGGRGRGGAGTLVAESAELVGNYAVRIRFSDGHDTGIYSWRYLREIDPGRGGGGGERGRLGEGEMGSGGVQREGREEGSEGREG